MKNYVNLKIVSALALLTTSTIAIASEQQPYVEEFKNISSFKTEGLNARVNFLIQEEESNGVYVTIEGTDRVSLEQFFKSTTLADENGCLTFKPKQKNNSVISNLNNTKQTNCKAAYGGMIVDSTMPYSGAYIVQKDCRAGPPPSKFPKINLVMSKNLPMDLNGVSVEWDISEPNNGQSTLDISTKDADLNIAGNGKVKIIESTDPDADIEKSYKSPEKLAKQKEKQIRKEEKQKRKEEEKQLPEEERQKRKEEKKQHEYNFSQKNITIGNNTNFTGVSFTSDAEDEEDKNLNVKQSNLILGKNCTLIGASSTSYNKAGNVNVELSNIKAGKGSKIIGYDARSNKNGGNANVSIKNVTTKSSIIGYRGK